MTFDLYINLLHHDGAVESGYQTHVGVREDQLGPLIAAAMVKARSEHAPVDGVPIQLDLTVTMDEVA